MQTTRKMANVRSARLPQGPRGIVAYLKEKRARYRADTWRAIYELIESGAKVVVRIRSRPKLLQALLRDPFFEPMKGQHPKEAHLAVMQFLFSATTNNQRAQANRRGRALNHLLRIGVPVNQIAHRLATSGGVRAVLEEVKAAELKATSNASSSTVATLKRQARRAPQEDVDENDGAADDVIDDTANAEQAEVKDLDHEGEKDEERVLLEVECSTSECEAIRQGRRAIISLKIEQVEGWRPISLTRYFVLD